MTRVHAWIVAALCVVGCGPCSETDKEPPAPPITYQTTPSTEAPVPDRPPTPAEVPVVEDFDDESETQINADNFREELDRLEAEISADNTP